MTMTEETQPHPLEDPEVALFKAIYDARRSCSYGLASPALTPAIRSGLATAEAMLGDLIRRYFPDGESDDE